ncbi:CRISPR-associated helicase/endonuclease Cas3 [Thermodesulfobacterium hydrogeniphilum]|uniref:CRISPR-associated helicase/endonuclease Cas3 n=1 Tax=Thermodesulfobacterium hydrogeniphilum TaxID=161156 RepID=UPI0006921881|nr:CRISPR-associated helicase/endonuclease Cas3 [Thermodesulfobacterium hydrogeniphilum]
MKPIAKLQIKNGEKYFQTLEGHTKDALKILKTYIQRDYETIFQFCERWNLNLEKFLKNLFLTVYLHDIGKLTKEFQENIRQNKQSQHYPHAYYGFFLLRNSFNDTILDIPIELAAILGHHTQLYDGLYEDSNQIKSPTFLKNEIYEFAEKSINTYQELGFKNFFKFEGFAIAEIPEFRTTKARRMRNSFVFEINDTVNSYKNWERIKSIFSYFFAILQICDDYASAHFSKFVENYEGEQRIFDSVLENPEEYVPVLKIDDPIKTILRGKKFYQFQKEMLEPSKFMTLFAPCGRGKTEAALLWALNVLKKHKRNKIVFAMPTQTTSNAMYDRLKEIFGEKNVSLYHGRSFVKLKEEKRESQEEFEEEKSVEEIRSEVFKGNVFFKPITITTVDHLVYSFVKGFSQADFALGNLQNAVIIFDEVHYYEKLTLEHLLTLFNTLTKMDIPHLLMSGTLPDFMLKKLGNRYKYIVDKEGLNFKPFRLDFYEKSIFQNDVIKEIVQNCQKGLTQFIILNTVESAKKMYLNLKEKLQNFENDPKLVLYHSQFTYKDRIKKEEEIYRKLKEKPFVLIATQVIEISLDISCDVMYSELAPPDALGQRAGRLNRKGKEWKNEIEHVLKIYLPEKHLPYDQTLFEKTKSVVKDYQKPLGYQEVKEFCDKVYTDYLLDIPTNLLSFFRECTIFGYNWKDITFDGEEGRIFKVRDEKIQHIDVLPECIYEKEDEGGFKVENLVKIPLYYLLEDLKKGLGYFYQKEVKKGGKSKTYWICRYPYTYELGFDFSEQTDFNFL